jgi:hypothetical protein
MSETNILLIETSESIRLCKISDSTDGSETIASRGSTVSHHPRTQKQKIESTRAKRLGLWKWHASMLLLPLERRW